MVSGSGGEAGSGGGKAGSVGKDARGDGGGKTKEVGKREVRGASEKEGGGIGGISSVSYEIVIFIGESEVRDTRCALRPFVPALPTGTFLAGDLRGDL